MRIYTKTGDAGETALFDGTRVAKNDSRVAAYGEVDELNAWIGLARANQPGAPVDEVLASVQRDLFALGAILADPAHKIASRVQKATIGSDDVTRLEQAIDRFEAGVPPLRRFIFAGGCPAGALLHLSRTVCRRAERSIVSLGQDAVPAVALVYVNRLSDLLFVLARAVNHQAGIPETEW